MTTIHETDDRRPSRTPLLLVGLVLLVALALGIVACQGDGGADEASPAGAESTTTTSAPADDAEPVDATGPTDTGAADAAPPTTAATATTAPAAPVPGLAVTSISAPATFTCTNDPEVGTQLTLQWTTTAAVSVTVSIDSPNGTYQSDLPPTGSLVVPAPCAPDTQTYYVTAVAPDGSTTQSSVTTQGV